MSVSVEVAGKVVSVNVVFKNINGNQVSAPQDATYNWSVKTGPEVVEIEPVSTDAGFNASAVVRPLTPGDAVIELSVTHASLPEALVGTLDITVLGMDPVSIELNGTVVDA